MEAKPSPTMPNGTLSESISWTDTESGYSLMEQIDLSWSHSAYPTPGAPNPTTGRTEWNFDD